MNPGPGHRGPGDDVVGGQRGGDGRGHLARVALQALGQGQGHVGLVVGVGRPVQQASASAAFVPERRPHGRLHARAQRDQGIDQRGRFGDGFEADMRRAGRSTPFSVIDYIGAYLRAPPFGSTTCGLAASSLANFSSVPCDSWA